MTLALPQLAGRPLVTDGGLETDLIFHHGIDLPEFAAFPLTQDRSGRALLEDYYAGYATVAQRAGTGLLLESATWRANLDWGARLGYDADALSRVNAEAVRHLRELGGRYDVAEVVVSGQLGPRGDGYASGAEVQPDEAAAYHRPQLAAFADAGADLASALTLTGVGEAVGVVSAAREVGIPVAVFFTVETDGRLPDGTTVPDAVRAVDAQAAPDYFGLNCAHPEHVLEGLRSDDDATWRARVIGARYNASTRSHAELDEAEELDEGDLDQLAAGHRRVAAALPALRVLGGCCGTDVRHVARLWGQ